MRECWRSAGTLIGTVSGRSPEGDHILYLNVDEKYADFTVMTPVGSESTHDDCSIKDSDDRNTPRIRTAARLRRWCRLPTAERTRQLPHARRRVESQLTQGRTTIVQTVRIEPKTSFTILAEQSLFAVMNINKSILLRAICCLAIIKVTLASLESKSVFECE